MSSLFLMVTITDRRSTDAFLQLYEQRGVDVNLRTVGSGTAVRETLATLGLEKTEKAVLLAVGFSCGVGAVSGIRPAMRAAAVPPVTAMRQM